MKWLALLLMTIDHIATYFDAALPDLLWCIFRGLGWMAVPLFGYALVLGYRRTRSILRYFLRLTIFAILTDVALHLMTKYTVSFSFRNGLYTLSIGLIVILGYDFLTKSILDTVARLRPASQGGLKHQPMGDFGVRVNVKGISLPTNVGILVGLALIGASVALILLLDPEYGFYGVSMILLLHIIQSSIEPFSPTLSKEISHHNKTLFFKGILVLSLIWIVIHLVLQNPDWQFGPTQIHKGLQLAAPLAVFALPGLACEKKPSTVVKYLFYVYYPLHLCLLMYLASMASN